MSDVLTSCKRKKFSAIVQLYGGPALDSELHCYNTNALFNVALTLGWLSWSDSVMNHDVRPVGIIRVAMVNYWHRHAMSSTSVSAALAAVAV